MKRIFRRAFLGIAFLTIANYSQAQTQMGRLPLYPNNVNVSGGTPTTSALPGSGPAEFNGLSDVALDASGNMIIAGYGDHSIRKVTPDGIVSTIAGNGTSGYADGTGIDARFSAPIAVLVDASQNIYVSDNFNKVIRKITPAGVVTTLAGGVGISGYADGTGSAARFADPVGMAFDPSGNILLVDGWNHCIRKITPAGVVTTVAGSTSSTSGYLDGMGSAARFYTPNDIVADGAGNYYITDA